MLSFLYSPALTSIHDYCFSPKSDPSFISGSSRLQEWFFTKLQVLKFYPGCSSASSSVNILLCITECLLKNKVCAFNPGPFRVLRSRGTVANLILCHNVFGPHPLRLWSLAAPPAQCLALSRYLAHLCGWSEWMRRWFRFAQGQRGWPGRTGNIMLDKAHCLRSWTVTS